MKKSTGESNEPVWLKNAMNSSFLHKPKEAYDLTRMGNNISRKFASSTLGYKLAVHGIKKSLCHFSLYYPYP